MSHAVIGTYLFSIRRATNLHRFQSEFVQCISNFNVGHPPQHLQLLSLLNNYQGKLTTMAAIKLFSIPKNCQIC